MSVRPAAVNNMLGCDILNEVSILRVNPGHMKLTEEAAPAAAAEEGSGVEDPSAFPPTHLCLNETCDGMHPSCRLGLIQKNQHPFNFTHRSTLQVTNLTKNGAIAHFLYVMQSTRAYR